MKSSRCMDVELKASVTSAWLLSDRDNMKFVSKEKMSATKGTQIVPIKFTNLANFETTKYKNQATTNQDVVSLKTLCTLCILVHSVHNMFNDIPFE